MAERFVNMCRELPIFVYGSLREGFFNYNKYLNGKVLSNIKGRTKGKLYHMPYKGYPALISGEDYVYGEIMFFNDYEETMKDLDELEGYKSLNNPSNEYEKRIIEIELPSGENKLCYLYMYNVDNDHRFYDEAVYVENGDWKKHLEE